MRYLTILLMMLALVSCGKETKSKKSVKYYSSEKLSSLGIEFVPYFGRLYITCQSDGRITNQQRIEELTRFKNSLGLNSDNTIEYFYGDITLTPEELDQLLSEAIYALQSAAYTYSGSYSGPPTECPDYELASSY